MLVKQMSVFVENTTGRLADITQILADNDIDIMAATIAEALDYGILRCIVEQPEEATKVLKEKGFSASVTEVLAVSLENKPGGFNKVLKVLADAEISVGYIYSTIKSGDGEAVIMMKVADSDQAVEILERSGVKLLGTADLK